MDSNVLVMAALCAIWVVLGVCNWWVSQKSQATLARCEALNTGTLAQIKTMHLMVELRDAIKENTTYLKQVYGDPDDVG